MKTCYKTLVVLIMVLLNTQFVYSQWVKCNGLTDYIVSSFAVSGTNVFAGTDHGVYRSTNNGTSWTQQGLPDTTVYALAVMGSYLFAGSLGVYRSNNNGTTWTKIDNEIKSIGINAFAVSGTNLFAGSSQVGGGVFLSTNHGTNWTKVNNGITLSGVQKLAVIGTNVFVSTSGGGLYISTNNGTNWTVLNAGFDYSITDLAVIGTSLYVATDGGLYILTNNGANWTYVSNGFSSGIRALAVSGTNLFEGTFQGWQGGVYFSTDNGTSWTEENDGLTLTNFYIEALAANETNLFVGTWEDGIWKRPLSEFTDITEKAPNLPQEFTLSQNYPNPFNPASTINYSIAKEGNIKLTVYNAIGNKVTTIVNDYKPAGSYSVQFNGSNLASGIYLYRLESGNYSAAKKFILMK